MKYFIDTEFLEGPQKAFIGKTKPTIDLISVGIKAEDGREYYSISNEFNIKEAWNRFEWKLKKIEDGIPGAYKKYWLKDNILRPIHNELAEKEDLFVHGEEDWFTYKNFKYLIKKYGKSHKQIAIEIEEFVSLDIKYSPGNPHYEIGKDKPEFYGYYCDYDWVVFCWLFGLMIDLPQGFPMYCKDLKQSLDEKAPNGKYIPINSTSGFPIKEHQQYPKQINEHNALADAKWNLELYKFLKKI